MKNVLCLAVLAAGVIGVSAAQASSPGARKAHSRIWGTVLPHHAHNAASSASGTGPLVYHGGPVMHTNTTYAIYWNPAGYVMQAGYSTLIDQFFTDVAADSGKTTNVYYAATQYTDHAGSVQYASTFGGSYTDTSPLPPKKCTDPYTSACVTDGQLRAELQKDIAANGWPTGPSVAYFVFTAKGIGSCSGSTFCAFRNYCAYHSVIGTGATEILYSNMPYATTVRGTCDSGQRPNANAADATISIASHEHNETITDPRNNAWYDSSNNENGDKCSWVFGASTGTAGAKYNQTINGHHYYLQEEYSNLDHGCVQSGL